MDSPSTSTTENGYMNRPSGMEFLGSLTDYALPLYKSGSTIDAAPQPVNRLLRDYLSVDITGLDRAVMEIVNRVRPKSLRAFDQIPMRSPDLIRQVKLMAPYLADKAVVFLGDHDGTSLLLGLMSKGQLCPSPRSMLLLDFDERLLVAARNLASEYGFSDLLETQLYNVFDPVPSNLSEKFDWFYTNPPYGCRNQGESARLFIARCCELARPQSARGCIILPDDETRPWTTAAMDATDDFLHKSSWAIHEKVNRMHQYHLDDDQELASSVILVKRSTYTSHKFHLMRYAGRRVRFSEIPHFYGYSVSPPYPRYITVTGSHTYWPATKTRKKLNIAHLDLPS